MKRIFGGRAHTGAFSSVTTGIYSRKRQQTPAEFQQGYKVIQLLCTELNTLTSVCYLAVFCRVGLNSCGVTEKARLYLN